MARNVITMIDDQIELIGRLVKARENPVAKNTIEALTMAKHRIQHLEQAALDTLSPRDTVALSIYQIHLKDLMPDQAAERAYSNADAFLRVRRGNS